MKKKFMFLSLVLVVCLFVVGCGSKEEDKKEEKKVVKNAVYIIDLEANTSTGYSWTYELSLYKEEDKEEKTTEKEEEKTEDKKEDKAEDIVEITDEYTEKCEEEGMVGCPGIDSFTVKGLKPGKVKVEFKYQFVTKKKTKTSTNATYILEVDENLNVKEVSHEGTYFDKEASEDK